MMFHNLHIIDIAIIIGYLAVCLVIGFLTSKKIKNIRDYAIGSGHISTAVLVGTFFATDIGAAATVGAVEKIYTVGLVYIIAMVCRPLFWVVASWVFGKNIGYYKEAGCISISDIMEVAYGKPGRWVISVVALCYSIGILALQVIAISYLFQYFLGISATACAVFAFFILVAYSLLGGIKAVALTDVMQSVIFLVGIPLACFLAIDQVGIPVDEIIAKLPDTHTSMDFSAKNIGLLVSLLFTYSLIGMHVPFIQRYLMANNETQLKKTLKDCFYMSIPLTAIVITVGILSKAIFPEVNPNTAFYHLVDTYLPIGIKGFVVAGFLAIIMSTADSWLNTASIICSHDILSKIFPKVGKKYGLLMARVSTLVIGFVAVFLALKCGKSMMDLIWIFDNIWSPVVLVPMIAALFRLSIKPSGFVISCITAMIGVGMGWYVTGELAKISTLTGMAGNVLGLFGSYYYQKGLPKFRLKVAMKLPCIRGAWRAALNFSENQVRTHGHNYFLAGGLGIMYFISSIFLYNPYSTSGMLLCVRSISALLCIGLIFHERLELKASHQKYLALYYHLVLMVIFPLISGYMMLLTGFSSFWVVSFLLAIIMMNFVCGITMTALLTPLGLLGAHILWKKSGGYVLPVPASMVHIGFTVILLVITARVRHNFQRSLVEMKEMYSTMIAHQVMQPIAKMSMGVEHATGILLPALANTAKAAKALEIDHTDLAEASRALAEVQNMGKKGTELVRGLLMMSREDIAHAQDIGAYAIQDVIDTALSIYSPKELARIKVYYTRGFRFNGSKMFMVEVIRNLVSNSFKYAGKDAAIEIKCGLRALYIRDNGRGIEKERIPYIFDPTRNSNGQTTGTGFGLAFVKRVVDTFSCSIICRSELGKYTEFVIGFPRL